MIQTKIIQGFPNYTIDSDGRVFSKRSNKYLRHQAGSTIYPYVNFWKDGKQINVSIHILVLEAFVGPRPQGMEACHRNGHRDDPRLENLRWDIPSNNASDKKLHGTYHYGEKVNGAKLNEFQVRKIRLMKEIDPRFPNKKIANMFNVSQSNISAICRNRSWAHI